MLVKFGGIITEGAGKVGGQIVQRGTHGQILRNLKPPTIRKGYPSSRPRVNLSAVASEWRQLTTLQRDSWIGLAATLTRFNKFGDAYIPSAYQIFCELNMNLLQFERTNILATAPISPVFPNLDDFQLSSSVLGTDINLTWSYVGGSNDFQVIPCFYPLQSLGASSPRGSARAVGSVVPVADESINLTLQFGQRFGSPPKGAFKIFVLVRLIDNVTGFAAPSVLLSVDFN